MTPPRVDGLRVTAPGGRPFHARLTDDDGATSVCGVCAELLLHPGRILLTWNWKTALMSSLMRGTLFFAVNVRSGVRAAIGAMLAEFLLRSVTSGFYGSITQSFRRSEPAWAANAATMIVLPLLSHALELVVHALRGTPHLSASVAASLAMTACTTLANLQFMRRGVLIVGPGSGTLPDDLWRMLMIVGDGLWSILSVPSRIIRNLSGAERPTR